MKSPRHITSFLLLVLTSLAIWFGVPADATLRLALIAPWVVVYLVCIGFETMLRHLRDELADHLIFQLDRIKARLDRLESAAARPRTPRSAGSAEAITPGGADDEEVDDEPMDLARASAGNMRAVPPCAGAAQDRLPHGGTDQPRWSNRERRRLCPASQRILRLHARITAQQLHLAQMQSGVQDRFLLERKEQTLCRIESACGSAADLAGPDRPNDDPTGRCDRR